MYDQQVVAAFISAMQKMDAAKKQTVQQIVELAPMLLRVTEQVEAQSVAAAKVLVPVALRLQQFEDDSFAFWERDIQR